MEGKAGILCASDTELAHFEANFEKASTIAADVTLALLEELHNTL